MHWWHKTRILHLFSFQLSRRIFLGLSAPTILTKKVSFPLSSSNDAWLLFLHVVNDLDGGKQFSRMQSEYCRVVWWWNESRTYLFKEYVLIVYRNIYSYLNRHICDGNLEKRTNVGLFWKNWQVSHPHGVLLQAPHHQNRQDDKCPTNAQGGWARNFVVCIRSRTRSSNERDDDTLYYVVPVLRPLAIF